MVECFEHVEELLATQGQGIRVNRVDRDVGWQVIILRSGAGIMLGADHHGDGGRIEVEEGVNAFPARGDGDGASGFQ